VEREAKEREAKAQKEKSGNRHGNGMIVAQALGLKLDVKNQELIDRIKGDLDSVPN